MEQWTDYETGCPPRDYPGSGVATAVCAQCAGAGAAQVQLRACQELKPEPEDSE